MKKLLVDGDLLLYKFSYPNQHTIEWDEDLVSEWEDKDIATEELDIFIEFLLNRTDTKDLLVCLSTENKDNFRYEILPTYKHNRPKEKPKLLPHLREHLKKNYPFKQKPKLEADDVIGILATKDIDYIIASIDKDLNQIPGLHYDWKFDSLYEIKPAEGEYWFYTQILTGDACDGYSGCPGIGIKKAEKILSDAGSDYWQAIINTYVSKGLTEEDALIQARVAKILDKDWYDFKKQEPILWCPKK